MTARPDERSPALLTPANSGVTAATATPSPDAGLGSECGR